MFSQKPAGGRRPHYVCQPALFLSRSKSVRIRFMLIKAEISLVVGLGFVLLLFGFIGSDPQAPAMTVGGCVLLAAALIARAIQKK